MLLVCRLLPPVHSAPPPAAQPQPAASSAAPQPAAAVQPPYNDTYDISGGIKCYKCEKYTAKNWGALLTHLRQKEGIPIDDLKGTYVYEKGMAVLNAQQRERHAKKQNGNALKQGGAQAEVSQCSGGAASAGPPSAAMSQPADPKTVGSVAVAGSALTAAAAATSSIQVDNKPLFYTKKDGSTKMEADGTWWQAFWVRVSAEDMPVSPAHMFVATCDDIAACGRAAPPMVQQRVAAAANIQPPPHAKAAGMPQPDWVSSLPKVSIKAIYVQVECPDPSSAGGRVSNWPIDLGDFAVDIGAFAKYVDTETAQNTGTQGQTMKYLAKFFHTLQINDDENCIEWLENPMLLASLYVNDTWRDVFKLQIFSTAYSWTGKTLRALKLFCSWQKEVVTRKQIVSDDPVWAKVANCIEQLLAALSGGISKEVNQEKKQRLASRRVEDAIKIRAFPSVQQIQAGVSKAMHTLHYIGSHYSNADDFPRSVKAAATRAIIGIVFLNGFAGRKMEWEQMTKDHVASQLDAQRDYLVCAKHKTASVYGSIAKWLAPGTAQSLRAYMALPLGDTTMLFAPVDESVETVDVPSYLRSFCKEYLPVDKTPPTVNLLRKWFHTELGRLANSEEGLMKAFQVIDGHSPGVARRHYLLKTPEDDALLAKALVHAMLGEPVPWPCDAELVDEVRQRNAQLMIESCADMGSQRPGCDGDDDDDDDDDIELDYFEGGERFGIHKPLLAICDAEIQPDSSAAAAVKSDGDERIAAPEPKPRVAAGRDVDKDSEQKEGSKRNSGRAAAAASSSASAAASSGQPPLKKQKTKFTVEQKTFIAKKAAAYLGKDGTKAGLAPPLSEIRSILEEGKKDGILPANMDQEQVRHIARTWAVPVNVD